MENKTPHIFKNGLLPLKEDKRDFSHVIVFGSLAVDDIPKEDFDVATPLEIKQQQDLDFCPGFSTAEVSEDQEGFVLDPYYQFAKIKQVMGDWKSWGADIRSAAKALVRFGSLPKELAPFTYPEQTRDFLADWHNYPESLDIHAAYQKKSSFFFIDGPHDIFDNIRVALSKHRADRCSVLVGAMWRNDWSYASNGVIPLNYNDSEGTGHMFKIFGQITLPGETEPRLKAQLSSGDNFGDKGMFYFPRSVVNKEFAQFGQVIFTDMPKGQAALYNDMGICATDSFFARLLAFFKKLF